ncbi:MAG: hypothetical protein ACNYPI_06985 [Arenicellales bacterium WSBS_2016_MAG_OTU3]
MQMAKKTDRRVKLLKSIMSRMKNHNMFSKHVSRKRDSGKYYTKEFIFVFRRKLDEFLVTYGMNDKKSKQIVANFQWEQN